MVAAGTALAGGFGGALDDRGGIGPGGGECARDHVEDEGHPAAVFTAPLEAADGTAAELERGGLSLMRYAIAVAVTKSRAFW